MARMIVRLIRVNRVIRDITAIMRALTLTERCLAGEREREKEMTMGRCIRSVCAAIKGVRETYDNVVTLLVFLHHFW